MYRPGGMSDDEEDDEEGFSFANDTYYAAKNVQTNEVLLDVVHNAENLEDPVLESTVVNAYVKGDLEVIQDYHEKHDVNKNLHTGWTPLLYATSSAQSEIVEYLLKHGADPNKHKDGFTPLMALCNSTKSTAEESLKCLVLLIEAKVDVNATNKRRETSLMYACKSQNTEFVAELVKHVTNINICDSDGKTALCYAAAANKPDTVKILLEHNADITLLDRNGTSAKDIADAKGFTEISALLADGEEDTSTFCEVFQMTRWKDLFPEVYHRKKKTLDHDVSAMLEGMGLEAYSILFQDMDIKTFLQLTEDDLSRLGMDISVHKKRFLEDLERFHCRQWHLKSLGYIRKHAEYTIYDGIITLTNMRKHIGVIASSFQYIKNSWIKAASENIELSAQQRTDYMEELKKVQRTLKSLKKEIRDVKQLTKKIEKENDIGVPAIFIGSEKSNFSWITVTLSVTLMVGLYCCKTACVKNFWSVRYNSYF